MRITEFLDDDNQAPVKRKNGLCCYYVPMFLSEGENKPWLLVDKTNEVISAWRTYLGALAYMNEHLEYITESSDVG